MLNPTKPRPSLAFPCLLVIALAILTGPVDSTATAERRAGDNWTSLFDGTTMGLWKTTNFGGEGEVTISEGEIRLDFGSSMSGITYTGPMPTTNYEIQLDAQRVDGVDFFCGLTFPVKDSYCSFIVGGWAGAVVGLSSIDGKDASENATTRYMNFETGRWYHLRVRVMDRRIQAWIDGRRVVDQKIVGRTISTRNEVDLSKPLGISTWETKAAVRNIKLRQLRSRSNRAAMDSE